MNEELLEKIKLISPGTLLRKALDDILRANMGALILLVDDPERFPDVIQGGFDINVPFQPEYLYELSKMDGAIIVSEDSKVIFKANVHLIPDPSIETKETGTRHRTAERLAKQLEKVVIAVSRRRNVITLYYKGFRYVVNDTSFVISRVNQAISALEKYRKSFDKSVLELDVMELENRTTLADAVKALEKGLMVLKIDAEIKPYLVELGEEGRLARMQISELTENARDIMELLIMDYSKSPLTLKEASEVLDRMLEIGVEPLEISKALGYEIQSSSQLDDVSVSARGYRLLKYTAKIPMSVSENVVERFRNIFSISRASLTDLKSVEGIGDKRARAILESINSLRMRKTAYTEEEMP